MGILARSLPGNLTIWREILTFEIKKYIRNSGKSDYLAGKNTFFQAVFMPMMELNMSYHIPNTFIQRIHFVDFHYNVPVGFPAQQ